LKQRPYFLSHPICSHKIKATGLRKFISLRRPRDGSDVVPPSSCVSPPGSKLLGSESLNCETLSSYPSSTPGLHSFNTNYRFSHEKFKSESSPETDEVDFSVDSTPPNEMDQFGMDMDLDEQEDASLGNRPPTFDFFEEDASFQTSNTSILNFDRSMSND
jgi:hypothetical protein